MRMFARALCVFVFTAAVFAQAPAKPTVDELIDEALTHNLRVLAERFSIPIAEARVIQARLRPNPTLLLQWQYVDVFRRGFSAAQNPAGPPEVDAGLLLPIVRGGKRSARIETAVNARSVAEADLLNTTRSLIFDIQNSYVDFLASRAQVRLSEASEQALEQIVRVNTARVSAGDLAKVELVRSEVALIQYQNQVLQSRLRSTQSGYRLQSLVGRTKLDPAFDVEGDLGRPTEAPTLEELTRRALEGRPDLVSARRDVERARSALRLQQAAAKPDWALQLWTNRQYNIGIRNGTSMTFQWNVPLPVSDRNQGEIFRARTEVEQAQVRVGAIEMEIRNDLTAAWAQHQTTLELVRRIETEMLGRARQARDIIQYSYTRGEATLIEFLDAQRTYTDSMIAWEEARAAHARSRFLLANLTGTGRP